MEKPLSQQELEEAVADYLMVREKQAYRTLYIALHSTQPDDAALKTFEGYARKFVEQKAQKNIRRYRRGAYIRKSLDGAAVACLLAYLLLIMDALKILSLPESLRRELLASTALMAALPSFLVMLVAFVLSLVVKDSRNP